MPFVVPRITGCNFQETILTSALSTITPATAVPAAIAAAVASAVVKRNRPRRALAMLALFSILLVYENLRVLYG